MSIYQSSSPVLHVELIPTFNAGILPPQGVKSSDINLRDDYVHEGSLQSWLDIPGYTPFEVPHYYYGVIHNATHHYKIIRDHEAKPHFKIEGNDIILFPAEFFFAGDGITIYDLGKLL
jgi:hypothetical protein